MEFELLYVAPATALRRFVGLDNVDIKKRGLAAFFLFDLRFRPKLFLVFTHFLLHQLLRNLGLHVFKLWELRVANVIQADDVKTELSFNRCLGGFSFA